MEIVWAASPRNIRQRKLQACGSCRARKKRCFHSTDGPVRDGNSDTALAQPPSRDPREDSTRESSPDIGRIGAYAPVNVLEDISSVENTGSTHPPVLSPPGPPSGSGSQPPQISLLSNAERGALVAQIGRRRNRWYKYHRRQLASQNLSTFYRRHLEDVGVYMVLPSSSVNALFSLYIALLDDLIPIIDGSAVFRDATNGNASIQLVQAVCLVACKFPQAAPHLRLEADGPVLSQRNFASKLLTALEAGMRAEIETDRLTKIRILALMHLHNDGPRGRERASSCLSNAIGEAWAMAIHHDCRDEEAPETPYRFACDMLWWTLRNFDRLSKLIMGVAPFMIDDTDIGLPPVPVKSGNYRTAIISLSTILGGLIASATKVYKASSKVTVDDPSPFPSFAEIIAETSFHQFLKPHQAYLELWYHLAAMMSCCYGAPGSETYTRRIQSAEQVISILRNKGHVDLPPLPLVPYVLSVATTVVYRAVIDCQRSPQEALPNIHDCCDTLDDLSQFWTSAKGIAKLARWLSKRITASLSSSRSGEKERQEGTGVDTGSAHSPALSNSAADGAQEFLQSHPTLWPASMETTNNMRVGVELGQSFGFDELPFDMFADMETAGFFDYLNSNYGESEGSQSLD